MSGLPTNPSKSFRKRNPQFYRGVAGAQPEAAPPDPVAKYDRVAKRIRQDKPMNKLEAAWGQEIAKLAAIEVNCISQRAQSLRFRLANGLWYKPDWTGRVDGKLYAWEVKGEKAWRGGFENLKMAATAWPEWRWILVWRGADRVWQQQEVLP